MGKTICLDFGNTRLKCAVFDGDAILEIVSLPDDVLPAIESIIEKYSPESALLSSVIAHDPRIETLLSQRMRFHKLGHLSRLPVTTPVRKPETIGADRLALVSAAAELSPGRNNLVIGLGTAITYNFLNKRKEFLGGGISPGMELRFRALRDHTALLPMVEKNWNFPLIGYDTRTNILSGVILGMAGEIDRMIDLYHEKFANLNVMITGGDALYFEHHLKNRIFADPDLLFKGLHAISKLNGQSAQQSI